jgi:hypothetical protein
VVGGGGDDGLQLFVQSGEHTFEARPGMPDPLWYPTHMLTKRKSAARVSIAELPEDWTGAFGKE